MARSLQPATRHDRILRLVEFVGMRRGVRGGSPGWFRVFVAAWVIRRLRRRIGSEPVVVYRRKLEPGETIEIGHLTETYGGKRVRRR
jgi:hypothetical protein